MSVGPAPNKPGSAETQRQRTTAGGFKPVRVVVLCLEVKTENDRIVRVSVFFHSKLFKGLRVEMNIFLVYLSQRAANTQEDQK